MASTQEINNNESIPASAGPDTQAQPRSQPQTPCQEGALNDNTSNKAQSDMVGTTCMELALEGERLCQTGDLKNGVKFFEEAIKLGTTDDRTLSAIYSQLGNAYFYLEDYQKALDYHKQDVTLVHSIGDEAAEAKACGNLGNTFKMLGKFDEAAIYCKRYLEISRKLQDEVGEGRALYNLGNVYHMQGKRMIGTSEQESGELSSDIKSYLQQAIEYYEANLKVVSRLRDNVAMGRAYGNLGNTHYLLGNFQSAVDSHQKRLELARQTNDKSAERRAYLNLGNANVFLGNFPEAIENYSSTLRLAQELNDKHTEAHSCYSLANTYTFLRDYKSAIQYHRKYIDLIKELDDKLGEGRACWSLVNIYQMVNDPESALVYARKHYEIAELLGDETGLTSARANIEELEDTILQKQAIQMAANNSNSIPSTAAMATAIRNEPTSSPAGPVNNASGSRKFGTANSLVSRLSPDKRQEQEQRRFKKQLNSNLAADIDGLAAARRRGKGGIVRSSSSERLFDMIAHFQSGRIDDQRCEILMRPQSGAQSSAAKSRASGDVGTSDDKENFTSRERAPSNDSASAPSGNGPRTSQPSITNPMNAVSAAASAIKATYRKASLVAYPTTHSFNIQAQRRPTVSAEHRDQLFDLIAGAQGQRMDEQRASLPALTLGNGVLKNPTSANLLSRGQTTDQSSSSNAIKPDTIYEDGGPRRGKERSQSIAPSHLDMSSSTSSTTVTNSNSNNYTPMPAPDASYNLSQHNRQQQQRQSQQQPHNSTRPKLNKHSRHFQTVDSDKVPVQDEKFLDSLMKYQSTRFNDQRSEFPKTRDTNNSNKSSEKEKGQVDNFFNLIVKFQSDRIDDQRSAPPARNKNI